MKKVIFPLRQNDTGLEVVNLQDVLSLMLEKGTIRAFSTTVLRTWKKGLNAERSGKVYGTTTAELVKLFQKSKELRESGQVEKSTASAINNFLQEWGVLGQPPQPESSTEYIINGQIIQTDASPMVEVLVRAFSKELRNEKML
ncbi:MAG: hypothetical protein D3923_19240, partial [Candidatus Electrothrix sp. AR3]|nr:hypothetical protein [Candidatus Electrothrix sp. AR3]